MVAFVVAACLLFCYQVSAQDACTPLISEHFRCVEDAMGSGPDHMGIKTKVDACFTNNGCSGTPETFHRSQGGGQGGPPPPPSPEQMECVQSVVENLKESCQAQLNIPYSFPQHRGHHPPPPPPPFGGPPPGGFGGPPPGFGPPGGFGQGGQGGFQPPPPPGGFGGMSQSGFPPPQGGFRQGGPQRGFQPPPPPRGGFGGMSQSGFPPPPQGGFGQSGFPPPPPGGPGGPPHGPPDFSHVITQVCPPQVQNAVKQCVDAVHSEVQPVVQEKHSKMRECMASMFGNQECMAKMMDDRQQMCACSQMAARQPENMQQLQQCAATDPQSHFAQSVNNNRLPPMMFGHMCGGPPPGGPPPPPPQFQSRFGQSQVPGFPSQGQFPQPGGQFGQFPRFRQGGPQFQFGQGQLQGQPQFQGQGPPTNWG